MPKKERISCLNCAKGICRIDHYSSSGQQVSQTPEGARADHINCGVCAHGTFPLVVDESSRYCPGCSAIWTPVSTDDEEDDGNGPTVEQQRQQRHQRQQEQREQQSPPPPYSSPPPDYSLYSPATTSRRALINPNLIPTARQFRPRPRPVESRLHPERQAQPRFTVVEMPSIWAELGVYY
ncbi:hypothetical protein OCU04_012406 [Sclerotinia nivalis]|uniref:Uncharacterized protein n=1 Tax=Sclerotinia nivalis TaxID=352851 RepID=A0A9X0A997_9HELO|nr:hypothetical protein OCU04_012406 [Sclerotinia nivalis]